MAVWEADFRERDRNQIRQRKHLKREVVSIKAWLSTQGHRRFRLFECSDSDCVSPKQFFDDTEREIATLQMNYFWRKTETVCESYEIRIGRNDHIAVALDHDR